MHSGTMIFLIGSLLVLVPFLGIPGSWKLLITVGCGGVLILLGARVRRQAFLQRVRETDGEHRTDSFVETTKSLFR